MKAFEVNAVDYLLKPVRTDRLAAALEKVQPLALPGTRVVAAGRGVIRLFEATDLTRLWSSEKYTVFRSDGEEHLTEEPLSALELRLSAYGFLRTHRAELVNLKAVRSLRLTDGLHEVELSDGQRARVSRRSIADVKRALGLNPD